MPKPPRYFQSPEQTVKRLAVAAALLTGFTTLYTAGLLVGVIQP